ncbi:MAG TPA: IclR family transcriptional regulator [Gaiella sp.]|nr:IclR family transcriptional regulator [Gaiella sp.]
MSQGTQSIDRAAQVLVHVLETEEPPTVGGLSTRLGLPKSTASRLVGALERQGLIRRDGGGGQLVPGAVLQRYARRETGDAELVERASEALDRLAQASGETINVGVPSLGAVQLLGQRDSRHFLGSPNWVGRRVPAHGSALGKVFYAYGVLPVPSGPLESLAPHTATTVDELGLDEVLAKGYAVAVEELEPGLWAVASAVRDGSGAVVAALSVSGPTVRLRRGLLARLGRLLVAEGRSLSAQLGYDDRKRGVA